MIHILCHGQPLCGFTRDVPRDWPEGERWVSIEDSRNVADCKGCLRVLIYGDGPAQTQIDELKEHVSTLTMMVINLVHVVSPSPDTAKSVDLAVQCLLQGVRVIPEFTKVGEAQYAVGMRPERSLDAQPRSAWERIDKDESV